MNRPQLFLIGLQILSTSLFAGDNDRAITAIRTTTAPQIDGLLNETVWQLAPAATDFLQRDPFEGQPATAPTEIRVLYDDEALYFGCMMFDNEPDKIVARLTRRDNEIESDVVSIRLDSYHDHKTAYEFTILASGVKVDILQFNDAQDEDDSWDVVWDVKTQILRGDDGRKEKTPRGWSAEIKIPFKALRYTPAPDGKNIWGINFLRRLSRKNERTYWALVRKSQSGFISHFGHLILEGNLPKPRRFELLPYSVGKTTILNRALIVPRASTQTYNLNAGFDLKYGLNSNLTLDLTVDPDFGQVEADPAVLNLTTFETFYPEKRPFFIEGTEILRFTTFGNNFGPGLFYSRRIGRAVAESREPATILGAGKITGKTAGGLAIGILQAVTEKKLSEPTASYSLVRLKQDLVQNSTIGMIATAVARENRFPAFTGGVDWNLRFRESTYGIDGFWASSQTTQDAQRRIFGSAGRWRFGKDGGEHWLYSVGADFTGRHYNINDIGFFRRPNDYGLVYDLRFKEDQPGKILRRWNIRGDGHRRWNFDGAKLFNDYGLNARWEWLNYLEMGLRGRYAFPADDDRESRGLGLYRKPRSVSLVFEFETDSRKPIIAAFEQEYRCDAKGLRQWSSALDTEVRPTTWAEINFALGYGRTRDQEAWADIVTDLAIAPNPISIFGFRDTNEYDVTLRSNLTFTHDLTLQIYGQAFVAKGHYDRFERLVTPTTLMPHNYSGSSDFNEKAFNLNVVWRWEYRPGSTLYLVWTQARAGEGENYFTRVRHDFRETFSLPAENVLLLKVSYWLQP